MSAAQSRSRATVSLPLKVKGNMGYFVIDMKGEFKNIPLFDATVGLKRILSKWLKPHHSLSCVVIVATRVINNSLLLHRKSRRIHFFFYANASVIVCIDQLTFPSPWQCLSPPYQFHSPLVSKLHRNIIKLPQNPVDDTICGRLVAGVMVIGGKSQSIHSFVFEVTTPNLALLNLTRRCIFTETKKKVI